MLLCAVLFAAGFLGIVRRAYQLQIVSSARFKAMAEEQYLKEIELQAADLMKGLGAQVEQS